MSDGTKVQKEPVNSVSAICTMNNPHKYLDGLGAEEYLEKLWHLPHVLYVNGQLEKGEEKGTAHLQYYIHLDKKQRASWFRKVVKQSDVRLVNKDNGASKYCIKEETRLEGPWEFGDMPFNRSSKVDWDRIRELAKQGRFDEIPSDIFIKFQKSLKEIYKDNFKLKDRTYEKKCLWYWGDSRTGKSRKARAAPHYLKLSNKWWDNYKPLDPDHKRVVIEDLGKEKGKVLADHIKLWADPWYNCPGEVKGSQVPLEYDVLIVTSNHHPKDMDIHPDDLIPIMNRFEFHHFKSPFGVLS